MKLLFVHDVKAKSYGDKIFARSYGYSVWKERYLPVFDSITICCRLSESEKDLTGLIDLSTGENVRFEKKIGMFKGPDAFLSKRIRLIIRDNVANNDAMVCRLDSFLGLIAIKECRKQKKPYLIELVGCAWDSFWNHGLSGKILAPYIFLRTRKEVLRAPHVVYVTKHFLQNRYPTRGENTNISNVEIKEISYEALNQRLERIDKSENEILNLVTVANVGVRYKGMHFVLKAISDLRNKGIDRFVYHVIGEGDQTFLKKVAKKKKVDDCIVFHGPMSHSDIFDFLKKEADIYVQPSLQEGLPRALIEAMSCALPAIGSDVAGIPELLDESCYFKRKGNIPKQIAQLLTSFDKDKMSAQSKINFEKSKEYLYEHLTKKRINFYKSCFKVHNK